MDAVWHAAEVRYGSKMTHSGVLVLRVVLASRAAVARVANGDNH